MQHQEQDNRPLLMTPGGTLHDVPTAAQPQTSIPGPQVEESRMDVTDTGDANMQDGTGARELFGGAMSFILPPSFKNVSEIRQVPDNQEVFVDTTNDVSIILELLELERGLDATQAASHFYKDLSEANEATNPIVELPPTDLTALVAPALSAYPKTGLIGMQSVQKFQSSSSPNDRVRIYLLNIRLENVGTDLLVTMNVPPPLSMSPALSTAGVLVKGGPSQDPGVVALQEALATIKVHDWSLFG